MMKRSRLRTSMLAVMLACIGGRALAAGVAAPSHLDVTLSIAPSKPGHAGDMFGVYAFEIIPCEAPRQSRSMTDEVQMLAAWLGALIIAPAHANHRDHFDRVGAGEVKQRIPLDRAADFKLGQFHVTQQAYCHVRLTLARLPSVSKPVPLPALETSIFIKRPANLAPLALAYSVPLQAELSKPWRPTGRHDQLHITLDTASAETVLKDASIEESTLGQRVIALWRKNLRLRFSASH